MGFKFKTRKKMSSASEKDILVETRKNGVTTLRMNLPKQLNGWTGPMMLAIRAAFSKLSTDPETKVAILTGTDPYYCAGACVTSATLCDAIIASEKATFTTP